MAQRLGMGVLARVAAATAVVVAFHARAAMAQDATTRSGAQTSDLLRIGGEAAFNWVEGGEKVLMVERNVSIRTDDATLTADRAVVWLSEVPEGGRYRVQVALMGNASVIRGDVTRTGGELFVTLDVRPDVRLDAASLQAQDRGDDVHYLAATQLRRQASRGELPTPAVPIAPVSPTTGPTTTSTTGPTSREARDAKRTPVTFQSKRAQMVMTPEGKVALVLSGDVLLIQTRANGDHVELQADSAVLFTQLTDARAFIESDRLKTFDTDRDLDAVYLEGDVRMDDVPGEKAATRPEQTLRASRLVYQFASDRAILTDALLHMIEPQAGAPLVVRAEAMKKLGTDRYQADHASITTTSFATPSIAISATKVTIRQEDTGNASQGTRTIFRADDVTPRLYGLPVFYLPAVAGTVTDNGLPLRDIQVSNSRGFGFGVETKWGLFESLGAQPPQNVDASYRLDYYTARGPGVGFDANYSGGYVSESSLQPWDFGGNITSYLALDDGDDRLGKRRKQITHEEEVRGRFQWDHQNFLTDGWQLQARLGYVSDGTFLEEWFRNDFRNGLPSETSLYLKRTQETEVFTALISLDTSNVPTSADQMQEIRIDPADGARVPLFVERLPEVAYHRLGDAVFDDRMTFVSNNRVGALHFSESREDLSEIGFRSPRAGIDEGFSGLPSYGYTGFTDDYVVRGDFRQELAYPLGDDRVRATPYGVVRYTAYSDSPSGDSKDRLLAGVGVRTSTQFYKVYDDVDSRLFDLHRLRHIVEPQVNLFASAQTTDRDELYVYDEDVDGVSDLAAAQLVVKQRFQTKRGGEGRWRSVDFLTLNTGVNLFANQPDEVHTLNGTPLLHDADAFRGAYFDSMPEASLARSTAFADATWRVSDTTAILGDAAWNMDHEDLATAAVGVAVQRDPRVRYFVGVRYIGEVNSTIGTVAFDYEISQRYALAVNQSFDLSSGQNENTSLTLVRKFEQYVFTLSVFFDQIEDEGGIQFSVSPRGLPFGGKVSDGTGGRR